MSDQLRGQHRHLRVTKHKASEETHGTAAGATMVEWIVSVLIRELFLCLSAGGVGVGVGGRRQPREKLLVSSSIEIADHVDSS